MQEDMDQDTDDERYIMKIPGKDLNAFGNAYQPQGASMFRVGVVMDDAEIANNEGIEII